MNIQLPDDSDLLPIPYKDLSFDANAVYRVLNSNGKIFAVWDTVTGGSMLFVHRDGIELMTETLLSDHDYEELRFVPTDLEINIDFTRKP